MAPYQLPSYSFFQLMNIERKDPYSQEIWICENCFSGSFVPRAFGSQPNQLSGQLVQRPLYGAFES